MRWKVGRRSDNVIDRRGSGMRLGGGRSLSIGAIVAVLGVSLLLGKNPLEVLGLLTQLDGGAPVATEGRAPPANDEAAQFVEVIVGETEDAWGAIFQAAGQSYARPKLVLFDDAVRSACGTASSAVGPFYCPADQRVYLDLSFFAQMRAQLGGGGDFAQAYVIAHEVGHHVQTLLGVSGRVQRARASGQRVEGADGLLVRQELQADCYAGVWAYQAQRKHQWLEAGDVEEALSTASAIGDDRLQKRSQGEVVPDAFTHGSAEQRVRWFRSGFESGDPQRCDTFATRQL